MSEWETEDPNAPLSILAVEEAYSEAEIAEAVDYAKTRLRLHLRRFLYSTTVLVICCASVAPFLAGHSLHSYWQSIGRFLLLLPMGAWLAFVMFAGFVWSAWKSLNDLKKDQNELKRSKI